MSQTDEIPRKKKGKKKWIFLLLLLLIIGGGGFGAYKLGFLDGVLGAVSSAPEQETTAEGSTTTIETPTSNLRTASLAPFVANLADPLGNRYIRMTLEVEVLSPEVINELKVQNPRIRDAMIMLLSSKTYTELSTQAGKLRLKNEILDRINQVLGGPKVTRVFFTELVVQ
ncbi:MAG: flagellar basal body-associated FliL family protein [Deltaproteobacteria bacterium]|jgi:flagellar FliL protein|nr:flagellar basal body-associated FliL family protein [Deltaproteobacteria bacterium]